MFPFFSEDKIVNLAEVNQWPYLEESAQSIENVVRTHLVPASGKLVLQKTSVVIPRQKQNRELGSRAKVVGTGPVSIFSGVGVREQNDI